MQELLRIPLARLMDYPERPAESARLREVSHIFRKTQLATLRFARIRRRAQVTGRRVCLVVHDTDRFTALSGVRDYWRGGHLLHATAPRIEHHYADGSVRVLKNRP